MIAEALRTSNASGLERGQVFGIQRARLLSAAGQVACELGIASVTVAHVVERAGVSRRTFYEIFTDADDCVLAVLRDALERAQARVLELWRSEASWRERVRDCVADLLCLFDEEPVIAQLLIVESLGAGREVLEQRARVLETLVDGLDEGRAQARPGAEPTRLSAEGALGGALAVLHARIGQGQAEPLVELAGALTGMLILPYSGAAAARQELARQTPPPPRAPRRGPETQMRSDPFKDAGMRLTYRTMRVLRAIAEQPGCSNRQVGRLAEMSDQGQVSKLLGRLERIGMIATAREQQGPGEPNAWTLTPAGWQVANSLRVPIESSVA